MKKNGFIATSVMFSFFLVFSMLSLLVLASYSNYRNLINKINVTTLNDLNDVITQKYTILDNVVSDGNFKDNYCADGQESDCRLWKNDNWQIRHNANLYKSKDGLTSYIKFNVTQSDRNASFSQSFTTIPLGNRKIYVSFKIFRNGLINCESSDVYLDLGQNNSSADENDKTHSLKNSLCGDFFEVINGEEVDSGNWDKLSAIFDINVTNNNQSINFEIKNFGTNLNNTLDNIELLNRLIGIKDIVVTDITNLYNDNTSDDSMKAYLDKNLPYITENYPIAKY